MGMSQKNPKDKQYLEHLISLANTHFNQKKSGERVIIYTTGTRLQGKSPSFHGNLVNSLPVPSFPRDFRILDGGNTGYMTRGSLKGDEVFTTGDGGPSDGSGIFNAMKQFNPAGGSPGINSEDYTGTLLVLVRYPSLTDT